MTHKYNPLYMEEARRCAERSLDDSTQVGCVFTTLAGTIVARGFNRFPPNCERTPERCVRPAKYDWTIHAEMAAVADLAKSHWSLGYPLVVYSTQIPCSVCMALLSLVGVHTVYCPSFAGLADKWKDNANIAVQIAADSGIDLVFVEINAHQTVPPPNDHHETRT